MTLPPGETNSEPVEVGLGDGEIEGAEDGGAEDDAGDVVCEPGRDVG